MLLRCRILEAPESDSGESAARRVDRAVIARLLGGRLLPALLSLAGFEARPESGTGAGDPDEASAPAPGQGLFCGSLTAAGELALELRRADGGQVERRELPELDGAALGAMAGAAMTLLAASGAAEDPRALELAEELCAPFQELSGPQLGDLCRAFEREDEAAVGHSERSDARLIETDSAPPLLAAFLRNQVGDPDAEIPVELAPALLLLGVALGDFNLAERAWVALKREQAGSATLRARAAVLLGAERFGRGHLDGYLKLVAGAVRLQAGDPVVRRHQATVALIEESFADARELWAGLVAEDPEQPVRQVGLGRAEMGLGHSDAAIACWQRALACERGLDPELVLTTLTLLLEVLLATGRGAELLELAAQWPEAFAEDAGLARGAGAAALMLGRPEAARARLTRARELDPDALSTTALLARACLADGDPKAALDRLVPTRELAAGDRLIELTYADALVEAGEDEEAAIIYARLGEHGPIESGTFVALAARSLEQRGDVEEAERRLAEGLEQWPDSHVLRRTQGRLLTDQGRPAEAVAVLAELLDRNPRYEPGLTELQRALTLRLKELSGDASAEAEPLQRLLTRTDEALDAL